MGRSGPMMSKAEADRVADMVLAIVREVARTVTEGQERERVLQLPEPTSTGFIDPTVLPYVLKRSA